MADRVASVKHIKGVLAEDPSGVGDTLFFVAHSDTRLVKVFVVATRHRPHKKLEGKEEEYSGLVDVTRPVCDVLGVSPWGRSVDGPSFLQATDPLEVVTERISYELYGDSGVLRHEAF